MVAVLIVGIVLVAVGALMLLVASLYPNRGSEIRVESDWGWIDRVVKFLIDLFKGLVGGATPDSVRGRVLRLGSIFFIVGVSLIVLYAWKGGNSNPPDKPSHNPTPSVTSSPAAS